MPQDCHSAASPTFRAVLTDCDLLLRPHLPQPLLEVLFPPADAPASDLLSQATYAQPALFALQVGLAALWQSWGITPRVVIGHSAGEYAAAYVAGILDLADALTLIATRGRLVDQLPAGGTMAAVAADLATVQSLLATRPNVYVATVNGPQDLVLAGEQQVLATLCAELQASGVQAKLLPIPYASHSPLVEPILEELGRVAAGLNYRPAQLPIISTLTGSYDTGAMSTPEYWTAQLRAPVQFGQALETLAVDAATISIELGPKPTLLGLARKQLTEGQWLPSLRAERASWAQLLESAGALFVAGAALNRAALDRDYPRQRLPLPTYPFQRQRYWVEEPATRPQLPAAQRPQLHPLIDRRVVTATRDSVFEAHVSVASIPFLEDHQIHDVVLAPAVMYLESIVAAGKLLKLKPFEVADIAIPEGLLLPRDSSRTVQFVLSPGTNQQTHFQVCSVEPHEFSDDIHWRTHATGVLRPLSATSQPKPLVIDAIKARCGEHLSGTVFYDHLAQVGVRFGPRFQGIKELWHGDQEILTHVWLDAELIEQADAYTIYPPLFDACIQSLGVVRALEAKRGQNDETVAEPYLPISIDTYRFYRHASGSLWVSARLRSEMNIDYFVGDLTILDENGAVVAELAGVHFRRAARTTFLKALPQRLGDWLYQIRWQPGAKLSSARLPQPGAWIVIGHSSPLVHTLREQLTSQQQRVEYITLDHVSHSNGHCLHADPYDPSSFVAALAAYATRLSACNGIILVAESHSGASNPDMAMTAALLHTLQAAEHIGWSQPPRLWVITRGAQQVIGDEEIAPELASLWGLGRVIGLERAELWGGLIDLPLQADAAAVAGLIAALESHDGEQLAAIRGDQRLLARMARVQRPMVAPVQIVDNGSYLITGGLGGLGLVTAEWLVEQGARHIVLVGRSGASQAAEAAIATLSAQGAQVTVLQADISQELQVARLLETIAQTLPPLKGIFHAAGVLDDAMLRQQTWSRFEHVLAPKVTGAWHLHTHTRHLPLDLFVMFSSGSSLFGSPGQANYAAANTFLDALAHVRYAQGLPGLSINWAPWSEVGAVAGQAQQHWLSAGMANIAPSAGKAALNVVLGIKQPQIAIMPIDWDTFAQELPADQVPPFFSALLADRKQESAAQAVAEQSAQLSQLLAQAAPEQYYDIILDHVSQLARRVLRLDASYSLEIHQPLSELGLDSLMAVELTRAIGSAIGRNLPATLVFNYPTVTTIAGYLAQELAPPRLPQPQTGIEQSDADDQAMAELENLSQDELLALLAQELDTE